MKQQCKVWNCGCWEYFPACEGVTEYCVCGHLAVRHNNTCWCGGRKVLGVCEYNWAKIGLIALTLLFAVAGFLFMGGA